MILQFSRRVVRKRQPRHNVFSPISYYLPSSPSSALHDAHCTRSTNYHGWMNSRSFSNSTAAAADNNVAVVTAEEAITRRYKRNSGRMKQSFSPLLQAITSTHPKNTNPPYNTTSPTTNKLLTRKQLLRLTPKQRSNLQRHRLQQHKESMSYLQQARTNVRSNLNYLSDTAGSNLKKNIATIQRLFRGEKEVWNNEEETATNSKATSTVVGKLRQQQQPQQQQEVGLDWERLPSEMKLNVQSNIVTLQNWLHKATDGMIPSPSLVNHDDGTSTSSSSIATRVQQFHQAKQGDGLVMDRKWLAWNIALALSPGAIIGLYLYSMQDEMKEYYTKLEEQERVRILGPSSASNLGGMNRGGGGGGGGGAVKDKEKGDESQQQHKSSNEKKGMGISSVFVLEGGGVFDKVKMAVNDLFLGGVEARVGQARGEAEDDEEDDDEDDTTKQQPTTSASIPANDDDDSVNTSTANQSPSESDATLDPTLKLLLQRIELLEKQLGIESNGSNLVSEQEQRQRERQIDNHIKERKRQSPMQHRRDSSLATKWSEEEQIMTSSRTKEAVVTNNNNESESSDGDSSGSSITLWRFVQGVKSLVDKDVNSLREMIRRKIGMLEDLLVTSKEEESCEEVDVEIAEEVNTFNTSGKIDVQVVDVVTSTTAVEKTTPEEMEEVEQAKNAQGKGFRAWISRLFLKKNSGQ
ncbi:hypothetical protein ACHAXM_003039 [Skeletonema potamos]